jgi:hypothetical protein
MWWNVIFLGTGVEKGRERDCWIDTIFSTNTSAQSCEILAWSNADGIYVRWSFVLDNSLYSLPLWRQFHTSYTVG